MLMIKKYFQAIIKFIKTICCKWIKNKNNLPLFTPEYYINLVGFYHCNKLQCLVILINLNYVKKILKQPLKKFILNKALIRELHPLDASILGVLANFENHGIFKQKFFYSNQINYFIAESNLKKILPLFKISRKYFLPDGTKIISLVDTSMNHTIEISSLELFDNDKLLSAMDSFDAISLVYDVSDFWIKLFGENSY